MHHCLPQLDHVPEAKSIQNEPILLDNHLFIDDLPSEIKKIAISPRLSRVPTSPSSLAAQDCLFGPSGGPRFQKPSRWFQGVAVIGNPHGPLFGNPIRLFLTPLVNGILPLSYFSSDLVPSWHILCQIRLKLIHPCSFILRIPFRFASSFIHFIHVSFHTFHTFHTIHPVSMMAPPAWQWLWPQERFLELFRRHDLDSDGRRAFFAGLKSKNWTMISNMYVHMYR